LAIDKGVIYIFNWLRNKERKLVHRCGFGEVIGRYYIKSLTEYKNDFDSVLIFERRVCECGNHMDFIVSTNEFLPSLYNKDFEIKQFIEKITKAGIEEEWQINIRTNMPSRR